MLGRSAQKNDECSLELKVVQIFIFWKTLFFTICPTKYRKYRLAQLTLKVQDVIFGTPCKFGCSHVCHGLLLGPNSKLQMWQFGPDDPKIFWDRTHIQMWLLWCVSCRARRPIPSPPCPCRPPHHENRFPEMWETTIIISIPGWHLWCFWGQSLWRQLFQVEIESVLLLF